MTQGKTRLIATIALSILYSCIAFSQKRGEDPAQRLKKLTSVYPKLASFKSLTKTKGGYDVFVLTVGSGEVHEHPAIALIGNSEGNNIGGIELTLNVAEKLLSASASDSVRKLLASTTFYILPDLNPDATAQMGNKIIYERHTNARSTDNDRDGKMDEDPYEDLNRDGLITMMRVEDFTGNYRTARTDSRVMIKADQEKGEYGNYLLLTEGLDNDKDGSFNEDGEGGININKNFAYNFKPFKPESGDHPVSEVETRAVCDFLYDAWNVFAVISFGPSNNLTDPWKYNSAGAAKRVVTSVLENDAKVNQMISEIFIKTTKMSDAPKEASQNGDLVQWAYYHYGRQSFSIPAWWTPIIKGAKNKDSEALNFDIQFLKSADSLKIPNIFVPWKEIKHPDFPDKKVEVGGVVPFAMNNIPSGALDSISEKHLRFLSEVARIKPQIELLNLKKEAIGNQVTRVSVDVYNSGLFPALAEIGEKIRFVKKVRVDIVLKQTQSLVSGNKVTLITTLPGRGKQTLSWLIKGTGRFTIEAGSPQTGFKNIEIDL